MPRPTTQSQANNPGCKGCAQPKKVILKFVEQLYELQWCDKPRCLTIALTGKFGLLRLLNLDDADIVSRLDQPQDRTSKLQKLLRVSTLAGQRAIPIGGAYCVITWLYMQQLISAQIGTVDAIARLLNDIMEVWDTKHYDKHIDSIEESTREWLGASGKLTVLIERSHELGKAPGIGSVSASSGLAVTSATNDSAATGASSSSHTTTGVTTTVSRPSVVQPSAETAVADKAVTNYSRENFIRIIQEDFYGSPHLVHKLADIAIGSLDERFSDRPNRLPALCLLIGPPGTGKDQMMSALLKALQLTGTPGYVEILGNNYKSKECVSGLNGAADGLVNSDNPNTIVKQLLDAELYMKGNNRPIVVYINEMHLMDKECIELFGQVLASPYRIEDNRKNKVVFDHRYLMICTSNHGDKQYLASVQQGKMPTDDEMWTAAAAQMEGGGMRNHMVDRFKAGHRLFFRIPTKEEVRVIIRGKIQSDVRYDLELTLNQVDSSCIEEMVRLFSKAGSSARELFSHFSSAVHQIGKHFKKEGMPQGEKRLLMDGICVALTVGGTQFTSRTMGVYDSVTQISHASASLATTAQPAATSTQLKVAAKSTASSKAEAEVTATVRDDALSVASTATALIATATTSAPTAVTTVTAATTHNSHATGSAPRTTAIKPTEAAAVAGCTTEHSTPTLSDFVQSEAIAASNIWEQIQRAYDEHDRFVQQDSVAQHNRWTTMLAEQHESDVEEDQCEADRRCRQETELQRIWQHDIDASGMLSDQALSTDDKFVRAELRLSKLLKQLITSGERLQAKRIEPLLAAELARLKKDNLNGGIDGCYVAGGKFGDMQSCVEIILHEAPNHSHNALQVLKAVLKDPYRALVTRKAVKESCSLLWSADSLHTQMARIQQGRRFIGGRRSTGSAVGQTSPEEPMLPHDNQYIHLMLFLLEMTKDKHHDVWVKELLHVIHNDLNAAKTIDFGQLAKGDCSHIVRKMVERVCSDQAIIGTDKALFLIRAASGSCNTQTVVSYLRGSINLSKEDLATCMIHLAVRNRDHVSLLEAITDYVEATGVSDVQSIVNRHSVKSWLKASSRVGSPIEDAKRPMVPDFTDEQALQVQQVLTSRWQGQGLYWNAVSCRDDWSNPVGASLVSTLITLADLGIATSNKASAFYQPIDDASEKSLLIELIHQAEWNKFTSPESAQFRTAIFEAMLLAELGCDISKPISYLRNRSCSSDGIQRCMRKSIAALKFCRPDFVEITDCSESGDDDEFVVDDKENQYIISPILPGGDFSAGEINRQIIDGRRTRNPSKGHRQRVLQEIQERRREVSLNISTMEWVQCDECKKWRTLPFNKKPEDLPDTWHCAMNDWDDCLATCEAPEEQDDGDLNTSTDSVTESMHRVLLTTSDGDRRQSRRLRKELD